MSESASYRKSALAVSLIAHATVFWVASQMPRTNPSPPSPAPDWTEIEIWEPPPRAKLPPEPEPETEPIPEPVPEVKPEPEPVPEKAEEPPPKKAEPPPKPASKTPPRPRAPKKAPVSSKTTASVAKPLKLDMTLGPGKGTGIGVPMGSGSGGRAGGQAGGNGSGAVGPSQKRVQRHRARCDGPTRKLRPQNRSILSYPPRARAQGLQGRLEARLFVDTRGRVTQVKIRRSPGAVFDREILPKLRTWTFSPAMRCGKAIAAHYDVVRHFRLDGQSSEQKTR